MALKDKPNTDLFRLYDDNLVLRINNEKNLRDTRNKLAEFQEYLGELPPTIEATKSFLARFTHLKPRSRYRYTQMIQTFMTWYGQPLTEVTVKIPKDLPTYIEDKDIEKLLAVVDTKRSHMDTVERDRLLIKTAWRTGLRREELATFRPIDIHNKFLIVREGKGGKDRVVPLIPSLEAELMLKLKNNI